jgi:hypothetical protein
VAVWDEITKIETPTANSMQSFGGPILGGSKKIFTVVIATMVLVVGGYGYWKYQTMKTLLSQPNTVSEVEMQGSKSQCTSIGGNSMLEEITFQDGKAYFISTLFPRPHCDGIDSYAVETKATFRAIAGVKGDLSTGMIELKTGPIFLTVHSPEAESGANNKSWCGITTWKIGVPQEIQRSCDFSGMLSTDQILNLAEFK